MIRVEGWEKEYNKMVSGILTVLNTERIDYISLGTLKHNKLLFEAIKTRFPGSETILVEIFPSGDGKFKYLKYQKVDVYRKMISWISEFDPDLRIELSLESDDMKELVFGGGKS